jgi:hypothetical protein
MGKISFCFGFVVLLLGVLLLCYCPWMFAISAVSFGIAAAISAEPKLRWAAVALIGVSVALAIQHATNKERMRLHGLDIIQQKDQADKTGVN